VPAASSPTRSRRSASTKPGVTRRADAIAEEFITFSGYPTFKGYRGCGGDLSVAERSSTDSWPFELSKATSSRVMSASPRASSPTRPSPSRRGGFAEAERLLEVCQAALAAGVGSAARKPPVGHLTRSSR
jgi:hypothetical protein